jgi:nucleoside-diphosphate kinase
MGQVERTLAIIKPDAVGDGKTGDILARIEASGLQIIGLKRVQLGKQVAQGFYAVHKERPFFDDLVRFMTEAPVVIAVLEGDDAIARWRALMGPTDSKVAEKGTIRGDFGTDVELNASHGSDAPETARVEISYFFNATEIQAQLEALT